MRCICATMYATARLPPSVPGRRPSISSLDNAVTSARMEATLGGSTAGAATAGSLRGAAAAGAGASPGAPHAHDSQNAAWTAVLVGRDMAGTIREHPAL